MARPVTEVQSGPRRTPASRPGPSAVFGSRKVRRVLRRPVHRRVHVWTCQPNRPAASSSAISTAGRPCAACRSRRSGDASSTRSATARTWCGCNTRRPQNGTATRCPQPAVRSSRSRLVVLPPDDGMNTLTRAHCASVRALDRDMARQCPRAARTFRRRAPDTSTPREP